ncbi:hypothetical protein ACTXJU_08950 [Glutamicibacter ardleyensis]|uniref:hypothetical protein n=1 Tax=Glutamicibacter ardleyensis TaxID=225894 RepID=UPI003FD2A195
MSITTLKQPVPDLSENGIMDSYPRPDQPRRRTSSPVQKLAHLEGYDHAFQSSEGGSYLRANGIYFSQIADRRSQIAEWRKLPDAGIFDEHATTAQGETVRTMKSNHTKEQAEIARLTKQLAAIEAKLAKVLHGDSQAHWSGITPATTHRNIAFPLFEAPNDHRFTRRFAVARLSIADATR